MAVDPNLSKDQKSWLRRFADSVSQPGGIAGMGQGGDAASQAQAFQAARNANAAAAPAPAPDLRDNISAGNLATANALGNALPAGVTRYQMDPGNEAEVYTTRGKDGSTVFTDNPAYAAQVGTGQGLRRSDVRIQNLSNAPVYGTPGVANRGFAPTAPGRNTAAEDNFYARSTQGPNANMAYGQGAIGSLRRTIPQIDDQTAQQALASIAADNQQNPNNPERQAANAIDSNRIVARLQSLRRQGTNAPGVPGYGMGGLGGVAGGAPGAVTGGLKPSDVINLMGKNQTAAYRGAMLENDRQRTQIAQQQAQRQAEAEDRTAAADVLKNYENLRQTDPRSANRYLFQQIPQDPKEFQQFYGSTKGRQILDNYLTNVLQPGAQSSLYPWELTDKANAPRLDYSRLRTDPKTGQFEGFQNFSGNEDYPAYGPIFGRPQYDPTVYQMSPAIWRILQQNSAAQAGNR